MKTSNLFLVISGTIFCLCFTSLLYITVLLFHSLDQGGQVLSNDTRLAPIVLHAQEQIRAAETDEDIKKALNSLTSLSGLGTGNELIEGLRKNYSPLLKHYSNKPKEADSRSILAKKKNFLDTGLNFYRKEVPSGDIKIRSIILNIIFDTHNSFLNSSMEMEIAYSKRVKEQLAALKTASARNREPGMAYRVATFDSAFSQYDRPNLLLASWLEERKDILQKIEKSSEGLVTNLQKNADASMSAVKRKFLYAVVLTTLAGILSLLFLYLGYKYLSDVFSRKSALFIRGLKQFGQGATESGVRHDWNSLMKDGDWANLVLAINEAEDRFTTSCELQFALSRNFSTPYFIFSKDGVLRLSNQAAKQLLQLTDSEVQSFTMDSFLHERVFCGEGSNYANLDYIRNFCRESISGAIETKLRFMEEQVPVELLVSHIISGGLVGGKIIVVREIRNEANRIDNEVKYQLNVVQNIVQKITHFDELFDDDFSLEDVSSPILSMVKNLQDMKLKVQEKEILWKSEVKALLDQLSKQKEILHKLMEEMHSVGADQKSLKNIITGIYGVEETINKEVLLIEENLIHWMDNRRKLFTDLNNHASLLSRVNGYEESVRKNIEECKQLIDDFANDFVELNKFKEEARLHAVNLSFAAEGTNSENYLMHARAYASGLGKFCDRLKKVQEQLYSMVARHPGGSLYSQLSIPPLDMNLVNQIKDEHVKLSAYLQRWKTAGTSALSGGVRAKEMLHNMEKVNTNIAQLNDTCLLISEQAKENLERWN